MTSGDINNRLVVLRDRMQLTNEQLANVLGVSVHTVNSWTRNDNAQAYRNCPVGYIRLLECLITNSRHNIK